MNRPAHPDDLPSEDAREAMEFSAALRDAGMDDGDRSRSVAPPSGGITPAPWTRNKSLACMLARIEADFSPAH